jgi:5-hydroxyisourate hydrolase
VSVSISTHVLDTAQGTPARGIRVEILHGASHLGAAETDADGRIAPLADGLDPGTYSLVFHPSSPYFTRVELQVELGDGHHHIPLLVSPYGCVTYRGS